ncbi:hypothetical protein B7P43_G12984 [Cryptotermes secundus]|uniref:Tc1-like transposase DDE domain-containing protein n=1 Tax=Cryptotermes secundus TaxID=105785 RepID=A0A2J7QAX3_9NEOP|nr:hypothetical protein B7P43_G12984 [Cryptotermes secundus]
MQMFHRIQDDEKLLDSVIFSDERTFHVGGKVDNHNCRIWSSENPRVSLEHVRDNANLNVFCALSKERVYSPFFMEKTITGIVYLDMLQGFLIPQLDEDDQEGRIHFQQDGAPPHYLGEVQEYLNSRFPGRWIRTRITGSVAEVTPEMLRSVGQETDYMWDVCRITN